MNRGVEEDPPEGDGNFNVNLSLLAAAGKITNYCDQCTLRSKCAHQHGPGKGGTHMWDKMRSTAVLRLPENF